MSRYSADDGAVACGCERTLCGAGSGGERETPPLLLVSVVTTVQEGPCRTRSCPTWSARAPGSVRRRPGAGRQRGGAPLLARYDLEQVRARVSREEIAGRPHDLWRYHEVLPVRDPAHVTTLGEGMTPLLPLPTYGAAVGVPGLLMKDEGLIPTGTFKARGAAVGVSRARELGVQAIAMPTNGNAGAAWSVYAARAGMGSLIVMPVDAPEITRRECVVDRCGALPRRRADQPRRRAGEGGGGGAERLPGGVDAQGAVPDRGQEDDGLRDRRAARVGGART